MGRGLFTVTLSIHVSITHFRLCPTFRPSLTAPTPVMSCWLRRGAQCAWASWCTAHRTRQQVGDWEEVDGHGTA